MTTNRSLEKMINLVHELRRLPKEAEWVEFKENKAESQEIGEYISALSNSAALAGKEIGYMIWGIDNSTHDVVGTSFSPSNSRVGNEELENWLSRSLSPRINFSFYAFEMDGHPVVVLEIPRASHQPVQFRGDDYIRVGSYKKRMKEHPEKERQLWRIFDEVPFESLIAIDDLTGDEVLKLLDYPAYFDLLQLHLPSSSDRILQALNSDNLIRWDITGKWSITNLGAILFARRLADFKIVARKAIRVVIYKNNSRVETLREQVMAKGYAVGFEGLIEIIGAQIPSNEVIGKALRKTIPMYPDLAVRELVANALIHQDFHISGSGPMVEIFDDRIEITNPGEPLVNTDRFLDSPPRSRNEMLADFLRRVGVCEERGSGVDKVVFMMEYHQLPAPIFEVVEGNTRAVLLAHRPLTRMDKDDRIRACYLHACLKHVNRDFMTNTSIRERFGIEPRNSATASRLIKEAVDAGAIRPDDPDAARKLMRYVPFWA